MSDTKPTDTDTQASAGEPECDSVADHTAEQQNETHNEPETPETKPEGRDQRYRARLREAEAQRDTLAETLANTRRAILDQHITAAGYKPSAFADLPVEDVLNDAGLIDADKLAAAVTARVEALGLARQPRRPQVDPLVGGGGDDPGRTSDRAAWDAAFQPR
ncbi:MULTISPECIES: hypothetical protein [Mycobacterium]|uniref:Scaffolding protein n=1 Tax=Mycobacterium intracellulare 1956 TaxID=1299331 RepID=X8CHU8_MYCIT|nr:MULTISPECIES: hypothetical protein [Mycobacterium]EUA31997.1 hypothetical protein I548_0766 [Mycobacterium intracellulare]EUA55386.1 hypothetical protein I550_3541 [Mycobacterium intracellulare 1956]UQB90882.1 hypothetical protein KN252_16610 [Mycobacterium intracellulare]WSE48427.1 hypothetical protein QGN30_11325 [Mycobacterium sp. 3-98]